MKNTLLLRLFFLLIFYTGFSQKNNSWTKHLSTTDKIITDKGVNRESFPKVFNLYDLQFESLKQNLFSVVDNTSKHATIISLPNADGTIEEFEVYEASNFEPDLQAQFPEIRAFSGKGITDKYATLKLSISPEGIQTMIFRTDRENEFIEPYSVDHKVYAVFKSQRNKGGLAWSCSTDDKKMVQNVSSKFSSTAKSSAGQLKTIRLAQSCNGEYANYFGATSAAQVGLVLAAFNATLTRCNGVYEKDLALHLNLIAATTNVIYYAPATDPYTTLANWNAQLQNTLSSKLTGTGTTLAANNAAYDLGHMFGKTGGGGNAGCIGCVCVNDTSSTTDLNKGSGITSPSDGIPQGDTFDIDYVVHEVGHQLGATHTFSNSNEGSGTNKEVGSGVTIMGYAGITGQDVAAHSIDAYHETSIEQIQNNLATKTCPVTTSLAGTNATPVVQAQSNYTIPKSTPFVLKGFATDANTADVLTYSWEQNDDGGASTGASSSASITKTVGPNFISWSPTISPLRYFPKLSSVIANSATTSQVGGDSGMLSEALSSVARTLNFRLTVRDNCPYSSTAPIKVGQTAYTDMVVNVNATAGPFIVTAPNTAVSWVVGTNQNVTWAVAGTTANGVNAAFVDIFLSTDGGLTYPIQLAAKVPNDGSEAITVPNNVGTTNRIMVKGYKHIFFDISNVNFAITAPTSSFTISYDRTSDGQNKEICASNSTSYTIPYTTYSGFSGTTNFSISGNPAGSTVTISPTSTTASTSITVTINTSSSTPGGLNVMTFTAASGAVSKTVPLYLQVYSTFSTMTLSSPANTAIGQSTSLNLTWIADPNATMYDVEVATDAAFSSVISASTVTTNSYYLSNLLDVTNYYWRVLPKNSACSGVNSATSMFTTGQTICNTFDSTDIPLTIETTANATIDSIVSINSTNTISDANVIINLNHTWINDLTATLISPAGTEIILFTNACSPDVSVNDINATFDDSGAVIVCGDFPGISGTVKATQLLSVLNGEPMNGTWTLRIFDAYNGDGGALNSWSLNLCNTIVPLSNQEYDIQNFTIFPNPNNGSFNVKFDSNSGNQIKISVNDISGRQIFTKEYSNSSVFDQNINLTNLAHGVYLVNVVDGAKHSTKKIIIE